jgi:hypothetical protein
MAEWHDEPLDTRRVCQKRRRTARCTPQLLDTLPAEWRELLKRWVQGGGNRRWETLRNEAGDKQQKLAFGLLDWTLNNGWVAVIQQWEHGDWLPKRVEFLDLPQLRAALGLRDKENDTQSWQEIRALLLALDNPTLTPAILALDDLRVQVALKRQGLIFKLHDWQEQRKVGKRNDFALSARNGTHTINPSEWNWLKSVLDLSEFGIEPHTPQLLIAAPLRLHMPQGQLDLIACPDFAALTPTTVQAVTAVSGTISCWKLVENLTCFEHVARNRKADTGVIWLPGFPPSWWRTAVGRLLDIAPAPADIACDPDPAGIAIALKAAELWRERGIAWQPWKMAAADLASLTVFDPLTKWDKQKLATLQQNPAIPAQLAELVEWMLKEDRKGEQEGFEWS